MERHGRSGAGRMLKRVRVVMSVICALTLSALYLMPGIALQAGAGWLAKIQFLPSAIAFVPVVFVGWLIVTLLLGRVYCSSVCPLGALQDAVGHIHRRSRGASHHYSYRAPLSILRNCTVALTLGALVTGITFIPAILDPYSIYGRMLNSSLGALVHTDSPGITVTWIGAALSAATLAAIIILVRKGGRLWCNTICPVGTTLGYISRHSVMRMDIDTDLCVHCGKCEDVCKGECIDLKVSTVDGSRCVNCFNCVSVCPTGAIRYTYTRKQLSIPLMQRVKPSAAPSATISRRSFMITAAAATAAAATARGKGRRKRTSATGPLSSGPVAPPGASDIKAFLDKCTGCGLCVASCQGNVLKPSVSEYGLIHIFHPVLDFNRGYCMEECTRCNNVCPTGALTPLTLGEKQLTAIGKSRLNPQRCIGCGACAGACPYEVIRMAETDGHYYPRIDLSRCVGCGACANICPKQALTIDPVN